MYGLVTPENYSFQGKTPRCEGKTFIHNKQNFNKAHVLINLVCIMDMKRLKMLKVSLFSAIILAALWPAIGQGPHSFH